MTLGAKKKTKKLIQAEKKFTDSVQAVVWKISYEMILIHLDNFMHF